MLAEFGYYVEPTEVGAMAALKAEMTAIGYERVQGWTSVFWGRGVNSQYISTSREKIFTWVLQTPPEYSRMEPARIFGPISAPQDFSKARFIYGGPPCKFRLSFTESLNFSAFQAFQAFGNEISLKFPPKFP